MQSSRKGSGEAKENQAKASGDQHEGSYQRFYEGAKDNRVGRLHDIETDRGTFRFKDNRKGE